MYDLPTAAVVAGLAADEDPSLKARVEKALDRMKRVEETVAMLVGRDVKDVPLPEPVDTLDATAPVTAAVEFSDPQRANLADKGEAMPDGSFPIRNTADLKRAIQAFGRASDPEATKRWIKQRARELDAEQTIPETW